MIALVVGWLFTFAILMGLAILLAGLFGGGALLMVGGRYIAKSPKATYWRSVGTMALVGLACTAVEAMMGVLSAVVARSSQDPMAAVGINLLGLLLCLPVSWLIIKAMFSVSFGRGILAWLPTLGLVLLLVPPGVAVLVPALNNAKAAANRAVCMSNLNILGKFAFLYKSENDNNWPPDLQTLVSKESLSPRVLICPCVTGTRPPGRKFDYFYCPPQTDDNPDVIVACDYAGNHPDGSRNVLFWAGNVKRMSEMDFDAAMANPVNAGFYKALIQAEQSPGLTPAGEE